MAFDFETATFVGDDQDPGRQQNGVEKLSWGGALKKGVSNIPSSAVGVISDLATPIMHPIATAKGVGNLGMGVVEKIVPGVQGHEKYADAVGQAFAERYGGADEIKRTLANDPIGMVGDLAAATTGVGGLARGGIMIPGKIGQIASKTGKTMMKYGNMLDPATAMVKTANAVPKALGIGGSHVVGVTTGAGSEALQESFKAGAKGGDAAELFQINLRNNAPIQDVISSAKSAAEELRVARSAAYRADMQTLSTNKKPLDFSPISNAMEEAASVGTYKGKTISGSTAETWDKINDIVQDWGKSNPIDYHTAEGFDALKKSIGDIRSSTPYGTPSRVVADKAYNIVKKQIIAQDPLYAKTMRDYEKASELIADLENTLSLTPKARVDTTMRKLQSILRNNANTNYGRRVELAKTLVDNGAENLMPQLAGQALNSWTPRGLQALSATGAGLASYANPAALSAIPFTMPRLMGEAAYYAGKGKGAAAPILTPAANILANTAQPLYISGKIKKQE